ncbi:MAG: hypothetical protein C4K49_09035 [Candidatus Thorarchaeota archaeon]|nr:MAG: hypothetical protein C4K49_09035 [Candidatus Thorarchaeota archaeon]
MRIKAVLRDDKILHMPPGSAERIRATAEKNYDRLVNLGSLLKVMGLGDEDRIKMLQSFSGERIHIWLAKESDQHLVCFSKNVTLQEEDFVGYQWQ